VIDLDAVIVNSLSKSYKRVEAVKKISFEVKEGEIFGFLGPNGAGKTTTMKVLTTLIEPTKGTAKILGYDIRSEAPKIRKKIGVVQQQESYEFNADVEKALDLYGLLWDIPKKRRKELIEELLDKFGLKESRKTKTSDLSIGLRKRLQVAREFMHDMDLLFLDEPTTGLDPLVRRSALDYFKEKAKKGLTIFFTTHILEEAEYICDRIALINNGRIIAIDTPEHIKRKFGKEKTIELKIKKEFPDKFIKRLKSIKKIKKIILRQDKTIHIVSNTPEKILPQILKITSKFKLEIKTIFVSETSLEEAFINLVKRDRKNASSN